MCGLNHHSTSTRGISGREVLIGIAILVFLAAVLTAIFLKQRASATRLASSRNLQQWGIALNLHLIDNENQLPEVGRDPVTPEQTAAWFNALPPYISQLPLASLPPGERPRPGVPSLWIDPASQPVRIWDPDVFYFNYGMNKFLQPAKGVRSFRINEINHPGHVVFLAEVASYTPGIGPEDVVFNVTGHRSDKPGAHTHVLFCDGHVELETRALLVLDPAARNADAAATGVSWFEK